MKKTLIIIALVALALIPAFAKDQQVGLELGMVTGINYRQSMEKNMKLTASVGLYDFGALDVAGGVLVEGKTVKIEKAKFYHQYGGQIEAGFDLNAGVFYVAPMGLAEIDYDFKWLDTTFTTFFRLGYGPAISFTSDGVAFDFLHLNAAIGLIHAL